MVYNIFLIQYFVHFMPMGVKSKIDAEKYIKKCPESPHLSKDSLIYHIICILCVDVFLSVLKQPIIKTVSKQCEFKL